MILFPCWNEANLRFTPFPRRLLLISLAFIVVSNVKALTFKGALIFCWLVFVTHCKPVIFLPSPGINAGDMTSNWSLLTSHECSWRDHPLFPIWNSGLVLFLSLLTHSCALARLCWMPWQSSFQIALVMEIPYTIGQWLSTIWPSLWLFSQVIELFECDGEEGLHFTSKKAGKTHFSHSHWSLSSSWHGWL